jgi:hypothetical protein
MVLEQKVRIPTEKMGGGTYKFIPSKALVFKGLKYSKILYFQVLLQAAPFDIAKGAGLELWSHFWCKNCHFW